MTGSNVNSLHGESGIITVGQHGVIYVHRGSNQSYDKVFNFFNKLILDEMRLIGVETWIAGGALREYFLNKKITTDIDLYFSNETDFQKAKNWFCDKNHCPIETMFKNLSYQDTKTIFPSENFKTELMRKTLNRDIATVLFENENALKLQYKNLKIDLVKKFRPNEVMTIQSFDFTVSMAAISQHTFYMSATYLVDLMNRDLVIMNYHHPLSTFYRLQKYIKMGFTISHNNMFELVKNIKNTPMAEINPIEFELDRLENPNGVIEVDQPIKKAKPTKGYGSTSGYGFDMYGEDAPVPALAPVQQALEPERALETDRGIIQRLFGGSFKPREENNDGY